MKIGVFDSGIGGVTVLNELTQHLSSTDFIYFGDTANVPYGTKSETQIQNLVISAAERMKSHHLDALVVACNTAASLARAQFNSILPGILIVDAVEAGVLASLRALPKHPGAPLLVFGTRATVKSHIYSRLLTHEIPLLKVLEQECPLLVPMIEEGWIDHPILLATVDLYTKPYQALAPGVALLACTHYPWIKKAFQNCLPAWTIIDSAEAVAEMLQERLPGIAQNHLPSGASAKLSLKSSVSWFFSDPESVSQNLLKSAPESWSRF